MELYQMRLFWCRSIFCKIFMGVRDNLTLFTLNFTLFQCYTLLMLLLHFSNEDTRDTIGCKMKMCFVEKCRDNSSVQKGTVSWILIPTAAATVPPARCVRYRTESCRAAGCLGWCSMVWRQHNTGHSYTVN